MSDTTIADYFKDLYRNIISFTDGKTFCVCFSVCKKFYEICQSIKDTKTFTLPSEKHLVSFRDILSDRYWEAYNPNYCFPTGIGKQFNIRESLLYDSFQYIVLVIQYPFDRIVTSIITKNYRGCTIINKLMIDKVVSKQAARNFELIIMFDTNGSISTPSYMYAYTTGKNDTKILFDFQTNVMSYIYKGITIKTLNENFTAFLKEYNEWKGKIVI